jgi:hypothetical protein
VRASAAIGLAHAMHLAVAVDDGGGAGTVPLRGVPAAAANGREMAPGADAGGPALGAGSSAATGWAQTAKPHEPQKRCPTGTTSAHEGHVTARGAASTRTTRAPHSPQKGSAASIEASHEEQFTRPMGTQVDLVRQASAHRSRG